tara:strand:+ start:7289 stop:7510 length:222 start_codon:yes stop_codon:yes gene_type:complete
MTQKQTKSVMNKYFSLLFKVAAAMLMSIFVFFGLGLFIDRKFQTGGISVIVGTFIGVFVGFYFIFKLINNVLK